MQVVGQGQTYRVNGVGIASEVALNSTDRVLRKRMLHMNSLRKQVQVWREGVVFTSSGVAGAHTGAGGADFPRILRLAIVPDRMGSRGTVGAALGATTATFISRTRFADDTCACLGICFNVTGTVAGATPLHNFNCLYVHEDE